MRRVTQDLLIGAVFSALAAWLLHALLLGAGAPKPPARAPKPPEPAWPAIAEAAPKVASYAIEAKLDSERH
ncbi:MAG TPA: hypothetical protein VHM25_17300, partial [Polyangiaceae bacterium]|nr:hypothetical protein [Polyangiaceae bacterium]